VGQLSFTKVYDSPLINPTYVIDHASPLICFGLLILIGGCSLFLPTPKKPAKDPALKIEFTEKGWKTTDPRESDHAWVQESRGDVILANSFCGEFQDLPLETLALKTFNGYEEFKPLGKNDTQWQGREAFEMEAQARVDGVLVLLHLRNYRRDHCYYDFLLVTPRSSSEASLQAFQRMLDGVRFQ
jgi:hypothetical protein